MSGRAGLAGYLDLGAALAHLPPSFSQRCSTSSPGSAARPSAIAIWLTRTSGAGIVYAVLQTLQGKMSSRWSSRPDAGFVVGMIMIGAAAMPLHVHGVDWRCRRHGAHAPCIPIGARSIRAKAMSPEELVPGQLLAMEGGLVHSVDALEDSVQLVRLGWKPRDNAP